MFAMTRGGNALAKGRLLALAVAMLTATTGAGRADDRADVVDVRTLPRLEGAFDGSRPAEIYRLSYGVPTTQAVTTAAVQKLLAANGWVRYVEAVPEAGDHLAFKKGHQGLLVSFTQALGRPDQSAVYYTSDRINVNLPFPEGAGDVVFDSHRPYLSCTTAANLEDALAFFQKELAADGWAQLSDADIVARWPDADLGASAADGARAFFGRGNDSRQLPVALTLRHRSDGRTAVDVRLAPFALSKDLKAAPDMAGLPKPERTDWAHGIGSADSNRHELKTAVMASVPAVAAFYRRELGARNWKEEAASPASVPDQMVLNFSSADETATLTLAPKYDLTVADLNARVKEAVLAARAKARKEADEKFRRDAEETAKKVIAADAARRAAQAASLSDAPIRARADNSVPVPLPENADNVQFEGDSAQLEFDSASSVKALAAFYRASLKSQGWKETPSVINKPTMVSLEFAKGGKLLSFTIMQMGAKVNVSADGNGLVMAKAKPDAPVREASAGGGPVATEKLDADPDSALPVPKQHTMSSLGTGKLPGSETAFRKQLDASIPANLGSVLAFYRSEFARLGWKEAADHAVVKSDSAELAYATPDGPATLKLGRGNGETTVNLVQKIPAAAAAANVQPKPGQARLMLANFGSGEATLTINRQTIKVAPGAGSPQGKGPTLDLPPGKYQYALKVAGGPARSSTIELAADDAWGLMISPAGEAMALQVY